MIGMVPDPSAHGVAPKSANRCIAGPHSVLIGFLPSDPAIAIKMGVSQDAWNGFSRGKNIHLAVATHQL